MNHARTAIAVSALALSAAALGATEASALLVPEPGSEYTTTPDCHWSYHPACHEVPIPVPPMEASTESNLGLDTTLIALGALGGIALGGAGLGITLVVRRRRPESLEPTTQVTAAHPRAR